LIAIIADMLDDKRAMLTPLLLLPPYAFARRAPALRAMRCLLLIRQADDADIAALRRYCY